MPEIEKIDIACLISRIHTEKAFFPAAIKDRKMQKMVYSDGGGVNSCLNPAR